MSNPKVLFVEGCDFESFPAGGQLSMARSMIKFFGDSLALVGMSSGDTPVGQWVRKEIDGIPYWFLSVCRRDISAKKPIIPVRLTFYIALQLYRKRILSLGLTHALIQAPEALLAMSRWDLESICYMFPGIENPLKISRYPFARRLWRVFDGLLLSALDRVSLILASADEEAIAKFVLRSKGRLTRKRISQLPTCVDPSLFRPVPVHEARARLGLPANSAVFVTTGRVAQFKGWELLLDAFALFRQKTPDSLLIFVGDGEDRPLVEAGLAGRKLGSSVRITGFQKPREVACYLNAADVFLVGSFVEGWSVSMVEALACGKPIVSTNVSGAQEMIIPGKNGFVVSTRNPVEFAEAIESALNLSDAQRLSTEIADRFSLTKVGGQIAHLWPPLCPTSLQAAGTRHDHATSPAS